MLIFLKVKKAINIRIAPTPKRINVRSSIENNLFLFAIKNNLSKFIVAPKRLKFIYF
ncbi:hypothetical protein HCMG_01197 [Helicobacter canadensis MIT 98-5491]|nr:hypothetical protein HCMG_01197 [Helicobacter canadensis MIT 98-5491]